MALSSSYLVLHFQDPMLLYPDNATLCLAVRQVKVKCLLIRCYGYLMFVQTVEEIKSSVYTVIFFRLGINIKLDKTAIHLLL